MHTADDFGSQCVLADVAGIFVYVCVLGVGVIYHSKLRFITMYGPSSGHLLRVYIQQEMTGTEMTWPNFSLSLFFSFFCH